MSDEKITPTLEMADGLDAMLITDPVMRQLQDEVSERLRDLHQYLGECRKTIQNVSPLSSAVTAYLIMLDQLHERPDDPLMKQMVGDALERICTAAPYSRQGIRELGISMITTWKKPLWKIYEPEEEGEADAQVETD